MVNVSDVRESLRLRLYTMATDMVIDPIHIVDENSAYTPEVGTPYQQIHLLPIDIEDISLAFDDKTNSRFLFQITLKYPKTIKSDELELQLGYIQERFKRGLVLNINNTTIRILRSVEYANLGEVDERYTYAISVYVDATEV